MSRKLPQTTETVTVQDGEVVIPIKVYRMRRKLCTVTVLDDASVIIKCPPSMSKKRMDQFLEEKHDWILRHYLEIHSRVDMYRDVVDMKAVLIGLKPRPLVFGPNPGVYEDRVEVRTIKDLGPVFIKEYGQQIIDYAWKVAEQVGGRKPKSITVKSYKARWGCCDSDGSIRLNYALAMLTKDELTYVIVHELCHLYFMDHASGFHHLLDMWYPDNRQAQKVLNKFSFLLRIYN